MTFLERKSVVKSCRYVDEVISLEHNITNEFMQRHGFTIRAYATATDEEEIRNFQTIWVGLDRSYFHRLPYTQGVSTSELLQRVLKHFEIQS